MSITDFALIIVVVVLAGLASTQGPTVAKPEPTAVSNDTIELSGEQVQLAAIKAKPNCTLVLDRLVSAETKIYQRNGEAFLVGPDGMDINAWLVKQGYAEAAVTDRYLEAEKYASYTASSCK